MAKSNNKIVQGLWVGKHLTVMERLCIHSFLENGHDFHLYVYDDIDNLPFGVTVMNGNNIIPRNQFFNDSNGLPAAFSDWFRYKMLFEKGGWWVDMDTICLKYFDIEEEFCFSTEFCDATEGYCIAAGAIKSPVKADFLQDIVEYIEGIGDYDAISWGEFGPVLLKLILEKYDSKQFIKPPISFCPLPWSRVDQLVSIDDPYFLVEESYAIHLWNTRWKIEGYNKDGVFHPECLYEKLKRKYNV